MISTEQREIESRNIFKKYKSYFLNERSRAGINEFIKSSAKGSNWRSF